MENSKKFYSYMALASIGIIALPVGIANFIFGYIMGDSPCYNCWGQREIMMLIGLASLLIVRYGFKMRYMAMIFIFTIAGMYESFYHFGAHALEDVGQGFGLAIFGIHTQMWAEVVFWAVPLTLAIVFYFSNPTIKELAEENKDGKPRKLEGIQKVAFIVFFIVVGSNAFQAVVSSGIPPYQALGDPIRFSLTGNEWSMDEYPSGGPFSRFSIMGNRAPSLPDLVSRPSKKMSFSNDSAKSPLEITKALSITNKKEISLNLNAPIRNIKYDASKDRYFISTEKYAFYIADSNLAKISKHFVLDRYYAATVDEFVGVSILKDRYRGMGSNKSAFDFTDTKTGTEYMNKAQFLDSDGYGKGFSRVGYGRSRLKTTRARLQYAGGSDNDEKYTYIVTQPNDKASSIVVLKQLNDDKGLAAEFKPSSSILKDKRKLGELYPTGVLYQQDKLLVLSKNYNTIAVLNLNTEIVEKAYSFPKEIKNARSLTTRDGKLEIVSYDGNKALLYTLK